MDTKEKNQLYFVFGEDDFYPEILADTEDQKCLNFKKDKYHALYQMGFEVHPEEMTPTERYMQLLADTFFKALMDLPELELARENVQVHLEEEKLEELLTAVPFAIGAEYITKQWIKKVFDRLKEVFAGEIRQYRGTVQMYLAEKTQHLHVPERIFFHLVEQKDADYPFAFLATYATRVEGGRIKHMPLRYALTEYQNDRAKLLELLSCLDRVSKESELIAGFVESGEMFHPLRLTPKEAYRFLKDVEIIEENGILCRIPNWWKRKQMTPAFSVQLGDEKPSMLGFDTIISVKPQLVIDGVALSEAEIRELLAQTEGLALLKGKWVEVDHDKLRALLQQMEDAPESVTLLQAMQLEMGEKAQADVGELITNGKWLSEFFMNLRKPETMRGAVVPGSFKATLRPYQKNGFTWLNYMNELGFGACLADDMGLGKTIQVLAYLEDLRKRNPEARALLVVPASLLGNWQREAEKFAPQMEVLILHGKTSPALDELMQEEDRFLTVTTYGMAARLESIGHREWDCVILDEAQAIKNPTTKQTKAIKKLSSKMRIAMTGTPIENDLTNLWSLFDFLNKGLLGTSKEFHDYCKGLNARPQGYQNLKTMISPFMLRRVKTDKRIIADLPEKLESVNYAALSKKQVVLYRKIVSDMERMLEDLDGIERRGVILATIMKLKQVCNHPDQYVGQAGYLEADSGKFSLLREICETIAEKRERVIVFTQFKEITEYLADFLKDIFGRDGYVLHGGTPVKKRSAMVEAFQGEAYIPFMVISVKAGGVGLNLTKANHVIHFDRWWNPAVENQATDRAFRIGQTKNVFVHKIVCQGTIEERIDALLEAKKELAENVIGSGGEQWITELGNEELLSLLRLKR